MTIIACPKQDTPVLTEEEFEAAYIAAHKAVGDPWSLLDIVRSYAAYQASPADHFLSKPEYRKKD